MFKNYVTMNGSKARKALYAPYVKFQYMDFLIFESDMAPLKIQKQLAALAKPIAKSATFSGNKSIHVAISISDLSNQVDFIKYWDKINKELFLGTCDPVFKSPYFNITRTPNYEEDGIIKQPSLYIQKGNTMTKNKIDTFLKKLSIQIVNA